MDELEHTVQETREVTSSKGKQLSIRAHLSTVLINELPIGV